MERRDPDGGFGDAQCRERASEIGNLLHRLLAVGL
jgi:hypothetical protein